jgi:8-amino-7-oxononanoate synthase
MLEAELAAFEDTPSALLFGSGYAANVGAITALVGQDDVIFSDAKNHASIVDGCRLARATTKIYAHNDLTDLQRLLRETTSFRRRLIVSDTLFSMDGDLADVAGLAELARQFDCMLMVDEAHATGVFGERGRGVCEAQGAEEGVDIRVGTLSKAFGSHGGFVVGPKVLTDWLANRARPYVFSTAAPDAVAAVSCAALRIVRDEPDRRRGLLDRAAHLREQLTRNGWNTGQSTSQIIPLVVGDARRAVELSQSLREQGFLVPAIRPPSVPPGESLLRVSVTYLHDLDTLGQLVAACS